MTSTQIKICKLFTNCGKLIITLILISLMSISFVCAEETTESETAVEESAEQEPVVQEPDVLPHDDSDNRSPHEAGIYFKDYFPVARMHNHSFNFIGGGFSYAYHTPWNIPVTAKLQNVFW